MINKWFKACLAIFVIVCVALMGIMNPTPASAAEFIIRMGNTAAWPNQPNWIMRQFKERIEAATDRIAVQLYEASAFGSNNEMVQGLQSGAMQVVLIPTGFYGVVAPSIGMLSLPGLFNDPHEVVRVLNQDTPLLDAYLEQQGMVAVAWFYEVRDDIISLRPITQMDHFKGLKIRTYNVDVSLEYISALGASPVLMPTADLPMALQQRTVDGAHCGTSMAAASKLYDIVDYLLSDFCPPITHPVMVSKLLLDELPPDLRDLVVNTIRELCVGEEGYKYAVDFVDWCYRTMAENGVNITVPTPEFLAAQEAAVARIAPDFFAANPQMKPIYDEITALVQQDRIKQGAK